MASDHRCPTTIVVSDPLQYAVVNTQLFVNMHDNTKTCIYAIICKTRMWQQTKQWSEGTESRAGLVAKIDSQVQILLISGCTSFGIVTQTTLVMSISVVNGILIVKVPFSDNYFVCLLSSGSLGASEYLITRIKEHQVYISSKLYNIGIIISSLQN